jgi:hypothetical protein
MTRFFNSTGPCNPNDHSMLPPADSWMRDNCTFLFTWQQSKTFLQA